MIWSWINTHHDISEHQGHQGLPSLVEEEMQWTGHNARVCKQIVFLKGKIGVRVEGRTIFLCNTDRLILQNFTGTVMSVARRKKPKYAHKWHHNANKASQREKKLFSKAVIWSVQFLSFNQMVLKQPRGSIWQYFIVLRSSQPIPPALCRRWMHLPKCLLCATQASQPRPPLPARAQPPLAPDTAPRQATSPCLGGFWKELLPRDLQTANLLPLKCRATWSN